MFGLRDKKCQQELLDIQQLTDDVALQKAAEADMVSKETEGIREVTSGATSSSDVHKLGATAKCYCCGKWAIILQYVSIRVKVLFVPKSRPFVSGMSNKEKT